MTLTGLWLPNATMHPLPDRPGRAYRDTREKKMLLHTTEGSTIGGAINAYKRYPPHLIYDWGTRELRQHIRLDFAAYALRSTDAENDGTVQVELVGFAAETPTWPPYALQRIAEDVLAPVHRLWPYELQAPLYDDQDAYGTDGSTRMTWAEFDAYSGLVGHQHSPGDTHWDPGKINIDQLLGFLRQELGDDMSYGSDKLADLWNGAYAQLQKEFPSDRPADWGYSIQQTNGQILNWVTPTLGRVEKTVGSIKSMVEGIAAGVARIEQKLDAFGSGGGSAPSGPVQLTDADLAAIQAVVLEALRR